MRYFIFIILILFYISNAYALKNKHQLISIESLKSNILYFNGKLAVISSSGSENWYHWLLQILPRLIILKESDLEYDRIFKIFMAN